MSIFVATDVYALFKKFFEIICNIHVQNEEGGGGAKGFLNNVKKNRQNGRGRLPLVVVPFHSLLRSVEDDGGGQLNRTSGVFTALTPGVFTFVISGFH